MFRIDPLQELTMEQLEEFIKQHQLEIPRYNKLQDYYLGKQAILSKQQEGDKPNNKVVTNFCSLAINTISGYFAGKPFTYNSSDNIYLDALNAIFTANDEDDKNGELVKTAGTKGQTYEILYVTEGVNPDGKVVPQVRFAQIQPEEMFLIYDFNVEPNILYAIRHYMVDKEMKIEIYSKASIKYMTKTEDGFRLDNEVIHYFGDCPVVNYPNNAELMGDFEGIISLQDDYNEKFSDVSNELSYFRDAYLMISNMSSTHQEDLDEARKNKVFFVDGDGKIEWLLKPMNDSVIENHKKTLKDNIFLTACFPDWSSNEFAGNLSGVAIRFKILNLEQICSVKERKFRASLMRRIRLITNILNTQGNKFDPNTIKINFTRNLPQNLLETADIITKLRGIISDSTLISLLPFVEDINAEMEKLKQEKEGELSSDDVKGVLSKYMQGEEAGDNAGEGIEK